MESYTFISGNNKRISHRFIKQDSLVTVFIAKEVTLYELLLDEEDWDWLRDYCLCIKVNKKTGAVYARTVDKFRKEWQVHRAILNPLPHEQVDHRDRNRLNNCKSNLRLTNGSSNCQNKLADKDSKSGIKGISFDTFQSKWLVTGYVEDLKVYLGRFKDLGEAKETIKNFRLLHNIYTPEIL